jgi:hypothetical protein
MAMNDLEFLEALMNFWNEPIGFKKDAKGLIWLTRGEDKNLCRTGFCGPTIKVIIFQMREYFSEQYLKKINSNQNLK